MCHVCSWVYYSEQMASLLTQPLGRLLGFYSPHTSEFSKIQSILKELFDLTLKMETLFPVWNLKRMVSGPVVPPTSHLPGLVSFHCRLFIRALLCRKWVPPTELPRGLPRCHGCQCIPEVMSFLSTSLDTTGHKPDTQTGHMVDVSPRAWPGSLPASIGPELEDWPVNYSGCTCATRPSPQGCALILWMLTVSLEALASL